MTDQKNTLLAIVLSALVLIGWQIFFGMPQMEKQKQAQQQQTQQTQPQPQPPGRRSRSQAPRRSRAPRRSAGPRAPCSHDAARPRWRFAAGARSRRRALAGSIALKGGRIDDLALVKYRETVDPKSPAVVLLAPSGSPHPFYAEFGWSPPGGTSAESCPARTRCGSSRARARSRSAGR